MTTRIGSVIARKKEVDNDKRGRILRAEAARV